MYNLFQMANTAKIYIGTSGWSYPGGEGSWAGHFYPAGKVNELEYYSRFFNTVEINSSFYRPPDPEHVRRWVLRVPSDFVFTAKLWQKFTHPRMYQAATGKAAAIAGEDVDLFRRSLEPLAAAGKLGALLAQFPPSFRNDAPGKQILYAVARTFREYGLAVELRQRSWSDDAGTAQLLRENGAAWVNIDEPRFEFSIGGDLPLTSDTGYFRFHGRNAETWWRGNSETRYRYLYSPEEITELADRIKTVSARVGVLFAFFNNHWQAYAPRNAVDMKKALQLPFEEIPAQLPLLNEE